MEKKRIIKGCRYRVCLSNSLNFLCQNYAIYHAEDNGTFKVMGKLGPQDRKYTYSQAGLDTDKDHHFKLRMENIHGYPGRFTPVETIRALTRGMGSLGNRKLTVRSGTV